MNTGVENKCAMFPAGWGSFGKIVVKRIFVIGFNKKQKYIESQSAINRPYCFIDLVLANLVFSFCNFTGNCFLMRKYASARARLNCFPNQEPSTKRPNKRPGTFLSLPMQICSMIRTSSNRLSICWIGRHG